MLVCTKLVARQIFRLSFTNLIFPLSHFLRFYIYHTKMCGLMLYALRFKLKKLFSFLPTGFLLTDPSDPLICCAQHGEERVEVFCLLPWQESLSSVLQNKCPYTLKYQTWRTADRSARSPFSFQQLTQWIFPGYQDLSLP